jgi:hypothetical protein
VTRVHGEALLADPRPVHAAALAAQTARLFPMVRQSRCVKRVAGYRGGR